MTLSQFFWVDQGFVLFAKPIEQHIILNLNFFWKAFTTHFLTLAAVIVH